MKRLKTIKKQENKILVTVRGRRNRALLYWLDSALGGAGGPIRRPVGDPRGRGVQVVEMTTSPVLGRTKKGEKGQRLRWCSIKS